MTKQTFSKRAKELYDNRMSIFGEDISFSLTYMDRNNGERRNVCVGTWSELAIMVMVELKQLYEAVKDQKSVYDTPVTLEMFAENMMNEFVRYVRENPHSEIELKTFGGE